MAKEMIGYVTGQRSYGFMTYDKRNRILYMGREENWKSAKEKASKRVKCLNDDLEFSSITEASKFYKIPFHAIFQNLNKHKEICRSEDQMKFRFQLV